MINAARLVTLVTLALASTSLVACAGTAAPESSNQNASAVRKDEPAADLSGTWVFDLESSDVAGPFRQRCASQSAGNAAKQVACWNEISAEAKLEKIRFSKPAEGGRATWTSFAVDGKSEVVFLELPVELAADGPGHVLAKVVGKPTGERADQFANANMNAMRIEVVDAHTIAMTDPKKGRLVFSKEKP
jgi:hypothetical protein